MPFNQTEYISNFNKNNYKMYQFRVKKSDINIINYLNDTLFDTTFIISIHPYIYSYIAYWLNL